MGIITRAVKDRLLDASVEVFFVSGKATKWWNARRSDRKTEICLLSGYYWSAGGREAGPFRTPSAAWRDVFYRQLLSEEPPVMDKRELAHAESEIAAGEKRKRRAQRPHRTRTRAQVQVRELERA